MFYLIGIGMGDEKDITLRGLDAIGKCDKVFLECYTSKLVDFNIEKMKNLYGKEVLLADRELVEKKCEEEILNPSKEGNVALLIVGSPLGATTHMDLLKRAEDLDVDIEVIDNAGIIGAVGVTGLSLYKFGRVVTIPKENEDVVSPYEMMVENQKVGLHTLILMDINNEEGEFDLMTAREGLDYLIRCGMSDDESVLVCGGLGKDHEIKFGKAAVVDVSKEPQCIIIPGDMHFMEEESLDGFR
tara:strand:- start:2380 stop:3108 length:729 start_codon:yes stop_codon:yes gene_type:complete